MNTLAKYLLKISVWAIFLALTPSGTSADKTPAYKYVRVYSVQMEDRAALMKVVESWNSFVKKEVPDHYRYLFRTDDAGRASWVNFAQELSDFEKQDKQFQAALAKYSSLKLPDLQAQWLQAFDSSDMTIWELDSALSYQSDANAPRQPFVKVSILHLKRGMEQEAVEALKQLNELDRAAGIDTPRRVYWLKYGPEAPALGIVVPAKDVLDYYTGYAKRMELRAAKGPGKEIIEKLTGCARKIENQHVTIHRELSYEPAERIAAK